MHPWPLSSTAPLLRILPIPKHACPLSSPGLCNPAPRQAAWLTRTCLSLSTGVRWRPPVRRCPQYLGNPQTIPRTPRRKPVLSFASAKSCALEPAQVTKTNSFPFCQRGPSRASWPSLPAGERAWSWPSALSPGTRQHPGAGLPAGLRPVGPFPWVHSHAGLPEPG